MGPYKGSRSCVHKSISDPSSVWIYLLVTVAQHKIFNRKVLNVSCIDDSVTHIKFCHLLMSNFKHSFVCFFSNFFYQNLFRSFSAINRLIHSWSHPQLYLGEQAARSGRVVVSFYHMVVRNQKLLF